MSTYYFLICDHHRAVSGVIGGRSFPDRWWTEPNIDIGSFLCAHEGCEARVASEHDALVEEIRTADDG